ncbi:hypothetical protein T11_6082 [Trichinella zimbabwensis]|uniref:Uncharacterized protein n=1 Tax=Trichinella zimbabwensis TaxID=268475 RepID=A0A0V1GPE6_9BILA|nr:hypothetical protein T11_6082 [Trichinella zimbabwensis]
MVPKKAIDGTSRIAVDASSFRGAVDIAFFDATLIIDFPTSCLEVDIQSRKGI